MKEDKEYLEASLIKRMVFALLDALVKNGGHMRTKELISYIGNNYKLFSRDLELAPSGVARWVNVVQYYSIPLAHAGFLRKDRGTWYITPEGEKALKLGVLGVNAAMKNREAIWKAERSGPANIEEENTVKPAPSEHGAMDTESVQELGRRSIREAVAALNPYEFQDLVAALFRGLGYHVPFVAPKGKDGGIDIIAHSDPLGAIGASIKIQVKHTPDSTVSVGVIRQLASLLHGDSDCGVIVTSGGFSADAERFAREDHRRLRLINGDELIDLWAATYQKLNEADQQRLPLVSVCFFARQLSVLEL